MTHIREKDHFWTYVPWLGQDWAYCGRCNKARRNGDPKLYTFKQALKIIEKEYCGFELIGEKVSIKKGHKFYDGHWGYIHTFDGESYLVSGGTFGDCAPLFDRDEFIVEWSDSEKPRLPEPFEKIELVGKWQFTDKKIETPENLDIDMFRDEK